MNRVPALICSLTFASSLFAGQWKAVLEVRTNNSHDSASDEILIYQNFQYTEGGVTVSFQKEADGLTVDMLLNCDNKGTTRQKIPVLASGEEYKVELPIDNKHGCYVTAVFSYHE